VSIKPFITLIRGEIPLRVLIASCIRQNPLILSEFLEGLRNLETDNIETEAAFIFHNMPEGGKYIEKANLPFKVSVNFYQSSHPYITNERGHNWTNELIQDMSRMKNALLTVALNNNFDYIFLVDSDLYLHPKTLKQLLNRNKDIISEIFWTRWSPEQEEMPNAWDYDHYGFFPDTLQLLKNPGCYQVGGTGACILISKRAIQSGVSYNLFSNISWWGEDRHFQLHAQSRGFSQWIDTTCPAFHIYRETDLMRLRLWQNNVLSSLPLQDVRQKEYPRITAMLIVKNEGGRYLESILKGLVSVVDDIAAVDDGSDDNTVNLLLKYGARVLRSPKSFFNKESHLRAAAWEWALSGGPDWVLAIDADEEFEEWMSIRELVKDQEADIWAFRIFDMWNPLQYREDELWNGHFRYTPMLIRVFPHFTYSWEDREHHAPRLPQNINRFVMKTSDVRVKHLGWMREEDRIAKYRRYMQLDPEGKWGSLAQYRSILDEMPTLKDW